MYIRSLMKPHFILFLGTLLFYQNGFGQYPEFIVKNIHSKLELVPEEETKNQGGYTFKQKGYKSDDMDAHFTAVMLFVQPIKSYPWTEKAHQKFLTDLKADTFTDFVKNFAMDTKNKQLSKMDPKKYLQIEMGAPQLVKMLNFKGIQFNYKFTNYDSKLLNFAKKNRFQGHRVLLFLDKYIDEITWEYVQDENQWNKVVLDQIPMLIIK